MCWSQRWGVRPAEWLEGGCGRSQSIREANALGRKNRCTGLSGKVVKGFEMQNIIIIK